MPDLTIITGSAGQTQALASALGRYLEPGDMIVLTGDLGAGKTCFTQGLAGGLGVTGRVSSPTYTIIHVHEGRLPLYHFDLYRLDTPQQLEAIGYEDYFFGPGVTVIEWGDKVVELLPGDYLTVEFHRSAKDDEMRILKFISRGKRSAELKKDIGDAAGRLKLIPAGNGASK